MKLPNGRRRRRFRAARLALCVMLVAAMTAGLPTPARACGLAVHHEIVHRAYDALDKQAYPELARPLEAYSGAVDAGAVFLDWGYGVKTLRYGKVYSDYAESAHENPGASFQQAYLDYLQRAVSPPYSEDEGKTIAFLFGLITHHVADDAWHFGPGAFERTAMGQDRVSSDFVIELAAKKEPGPAPFSLMLPYSVMSVGKGAIQISELQ